LHGPCFAVGKDVGAAGYPACWRCPALTRARTPVLPYSACSAAVFVALFVNWETITGNVHDVHNDAVVPRFVGTYGLGLFTECDWVQVEVPVLGASVVTSCEAWMAQVSAPAQWS
jgi:hypothetical protein